LCTWASIRSTRPGSTPAIDSGRVVQSKPSKKLPATSSSRDSRLRIRSICGSHAHDASTTPPMPTTCSLILAFSSTAPTAGAS
jgi:hypothetical protein